MPTVNSQNFTTLYSATAQEIVPAEPYGNANVEAFLNIGTDGGNTVQNILANGDIIANGNIESNNFVADTTRVFIGPNAQGVVAVANTISIGNNAGTSNDIDSIAIGANAGGYGQFNVAIGTLAGVTTYDHAVAIGATSGTGQGNYSVSVGDTAGYLGQGYNAVAIGATAGFNTQGANSVAIGYGAGHTNQAANSIVINATGTQLNQTTANTLTVKPVRNANVGNVLFYNPTSGEITYDILNSISPATANFANFAGNVTNSAQPNITSVGTLTSLTVSGNANVGALNVNANSGIYTVFDGGGTYPEHIMWRSKSFIGGGPEGTAQWQPSTSRGTEASPANIGAGDTILKFETAVNTGTTTPYGPYTGYSYGPAIRAINTFNPGVDPNPIGYAYSYGNIQFTTAGNLNSNDYVLRTDLGPNGVSVYGFVPTNGFSAADTKFDINLSNGSSYSPTVTAGSFDGNGNLTVANTVISENLDVGNSSNTTLQFYTNTSVVPGTSSNVSLLTTGGYNGLNWSFNEATLIEGWDSSIDTAFIDHGWYGNDTVSGNVVYGGGMSTTMYGPVGSALSPGIFNISVFEPGSDLSNINTGTFTGFQVGQGGFAAIVGSQTNNPAIGAFIYGNTTQSQASAIRINRRRGNGDARTNVVANDYLGNVEWRGSGSATGSLNSKIVTFGAKVDSSYGGPGNVMPIGFEMDVVNNSNAFIAHSFYANGNVNFSNNINSSSLSVNNGSSGNTYRYNPNLITLTTATGSNTFQSVFAGSNTSAGVNEAIVFSSSNATANTPAYTQGFYSLESGNAVQMASIQVAGRGSANAANLATPGNIYFRAYSPNSNLQTGTLNSLFTLAGDQMFMAINAPGPANTGVWGTRYFGQATDQTEGIAFTIQRNRGNNASRTTLLAGDYIGNIHFIAGGTGATVGSRQARIAPRVDSSFIGSGTDIPIGIDLQVCNTTANITHNFYSNGTVALSGDVSASNVSVNTNGFMKLASYTAAGLTAITGQIGWMAAVSDSAGGGNPNGMIAFWDTTNARWSYVHDNSAV